MFKTVRNWKVLSDKIQYLSNVEMIEFFTVNNFERLDRGDNYLTSRAVFAVNDKVVIKIARNNCGMEQNYNEQNVYSRLTNYKKRFFARLYLDACINGSANFMERVQTRKGNVKEFNSLLKNNSIRKFKDIHVNIGKEFNNEYPMDLQNTNIGIKNNRFVCLDYGGSQYVYDMYKAARKQHGTPSRGKRWYNINFGLKEI